MPQIVLKNVTKRWKNFYGVDDLSLTIEDNAFVTLLGPSGCGKTTTLRMIAGLETPTEGRIEIGDQVVFDSEAGINVPASKRRVGFLFQNYALWPNMTVYQNISFGLKNVKEELPVLDIEAKVVSDLLRTLRNPERIRDIAEECRGRDGKMEMEKLYLRLINTFTISMDTAKKLYALGIQDAQDPAGRSREETGKLQQKWKELEDAHAARGEKLNEKCEVMVNGVVRRQVRKLSREEIDLAVRRAARVVKIGMFMDRYPAELSGGQQQRVAIARTLAPQPQVMFMDEPLSNLDAKLRIQMRYELQRLHVETGSTFVYVTHDQMEAMTLSTKICLINNGVLQQYDPPLTVYNHPVNLFTADFVGNPSINFLNAKGSQGEDGSFVFTILNGQKVCFTPSQPIDMKEWFRERTVREEKEKQQNQKRAVEKENKDEVFQYHIDTVEEEDDSLAEESVPTDEDFVLAVRPERIRITEKKEGTLEAVVYGAMPSGMESTLKIRVGDYLLTGVIFGDVTYPIGARVRIDLFGREVLLYDRASGRLVTGGTIQLL